MMFKYEFISHIHIHYPHATWHMAHGTYMAHGTLHTAHWPHGTHCTLHMHIVHYCGTWEMGCNMGHGPHACTLHTIHPTRAFCFLHFAFCTYTYIHMRGVAVNININR
jgi:hypothetical protein